jgi:hypothetical protein
LTLAYSAIWLAVCGFLVGLWRRGHQLEHEVAELRRRLDAALGAGASSSSSSSPARGDSR